MGQRNRWSVMTNKSNGWGALSSPRCHTLPTVVGTHNNIAAESSGTAAQQYTLPAVAIAALVRNNHHCERPHQGSSSALKLSYYSICHTSCTCLVLLAP
jgi:hypothetical protein